MLTDSEREKKKRLENFGNRFFLYVKSDIMKNIYKNIVYNSFQTRENFLETIYIDYLYIRLVGYSINQGFSLH